MSDSQANEERKEPVDPKLLKEILDALLQNNPDVANKYNKEDLYALIQTLYEGETILPFAPIYYNEEKGESPEASKPVIKRIGQGKLFRYKTLDEEENGEHAIKDGVSYNYPVSSTDRDLESGVYDFKNRGLDYDPEAGQEEVGGKANRKSHKSKKAHKSRKVRKSKKTRKTRK